MSSLALITVASVTWLCAGMTPMAFTGSWSPRASRDHSFLAVWGVVLAISATSFLVAQLWFSRPNAWEIALAGSATFVVGAYVTMGWHRRAPAFFAAAVFVLAITSIDLGNVMHHEGQVNNGVRQLASAAGGMLLIIGALWLRPRRRAVS